MQPYHDILADLLASFGARNRYAYDLTADGHRVMMESEPRCFDGTTRVRISVDGVSLSMDATDRIRVDPDGVVTLIGRNGSVSAYFPLCVPRDGVASQPVPAPDATDATGPETDGTDTDAPETDTDDDGTDGD